MKTKFIRSACILLASTCFLGYAKPPKHTPTPTATPTPTPTATPKPTPSATATPTATPAGSLGLGIIYLLRSDAAGRPWPDLSADPSWKNPLVQGLAFRTQWSKIEPSQDKFDWSDLDQVAPLAKQYGKKWSLIVTAGVTTPDWVAKAGAQMMTVHADSVGATDMPLIWDPIFQKTWGAAIGAAGARYGADPNLAYVVMSGAGRRAESFYVTTPDDQAVFEALGGLPKWQAGAEWMIDTYMAAFPARLPMILDLGAPEPTDAGQATLAAVCDYAVAKYGARFGVKSDGLEAGSSGNQYGQQEIQKLSPRALVGFQMGLPDNGKGQLGAALTAGIKLGAHFIEVFAGDCNDPAQADALKSAGAQLSAPAAQQRPSISVSP